jgi:hypothetical protein
MAQHRKTRQKQIQTSASALTYDVVRFLKVPLLASKLVSHRRGLSTSRELILPKLFAGCRAALKTENFGNGVGLLHLNRFFRTFGAGLSFA